MKLYWKGTILLHLLVLSSVTYGQHYESKCGTWRCDVKTLTDKDGRLLLVKEVVPSSIDQLVNKRSPKVLHHNDYSDSKLPRYPDENQVVEITAFVIKVKYEKDDHDLHLVLKSIASENSMVGEIPDPNCQNFNEFPKLRELFIKTRKQGNKIWDKLKETDRPVKVVITGVPFWDSEHKNRPTGSSQYFREIHPVISIVAL